MSIEKLCGVLKIVCAKLSYFVYKALSDVCVNINIEKIYTKFWFLFGDFHQDPHRPFGDFENPLGQHALEDFQNPLRAQGIWMKIPSQKPEFSIYIFFEQK